MSDQIDAAVDLAKRTFPRVRVTGGVSQEEIHVLEKVVSASIPEDYKHFLSRYGTFGFYGLEIYGLISGNIYGEGPPNALFMTESDMATASIPSGSVVIASTGYGSVFLLDCLRQKVYEWSYSGEVPEEAAAYASYGDFFSEQVADTVAMYLEEQG